MSVNIGTCWEYGYEFPSSAQITLEGTALAISVWNAILFFFQKQTPHQSIITWTYAKKVTEEFRYALFKIFRCQQGSHYRSGIRGRLLIMNCRLQWLVDERASVPRILTAWVHCVICLAGYLLIFSFADPFAGYLPSTKCDNDRQIKKSFDNYGFSLYTQRQKMSRITTWVVKTTHTPILGPGKDQFGVELFLLLNPSMKP